MLGGRCVDGELERAFGCLEAFELCGLELGEDVAAVGQVAEVTLRGGEPSDHLAIDPKGGNPVGEALFGFGDKLEDRSLGETRGWIASVRRGWRGRGRSLQRTTRRLSGSGQWRGGGGLVLVHGCGEDGGLELGVGAVLAERFDVAGGLPPFEDVDAIVLEGSATRWNGMQPVPHGLLR